VSGAEQRSAETAELMRRFNAVFLLHAPAALAGLVADDCVIENSTPAPNGSRHVGRDACVELWTKIATAPGTHFELEGVMACGDRATILWRYCWGDEPSQSVRGVNLMKVRNGRIVEALGYVKGP
jgi:hypothetical protein